MPPQTTRIQSRQPKAEIELADLLDRALHKGLVLWGEATISVAGVDLVYLGLKVLLASTDTANRLKTAANITPVG